MQRLQHLKSTVHESLRSSVAKGPFDQQSVNALMQSYSAFKSAQSPETPHKVPPLAVHSLHSPDVCATHTTRHDTHTHTHTHTTTRTRDRGR